jgi:hypothetical protein
VVTQEVIMESTNLSSINLNTIDDTNKYFNNFFNQTIDISPAQDDAIVSYFQTITDNRESAVALASAVIYTSKQQLTDPMQILDEFKKLDKGQLNSYLCMFLNLNRVGTSLLGINTQPAKSKYVQRSIRL